MRQSDLNNSILNQETIKDELDKKLDLFFGHAWTVFASFFFWQIFSKDILFSTEDNQLFHWTSSSIIVVIFQLIHFKIRSKERILIKVKTQLSLEQNIKIVNETSNNLNLRQITSQLNYFQYYKTYPFLIFKNPIYKVTLIPFDSIIYVNIRTCGIDNIRMPFNFGFCNLFQKRLLRKIKLLTTQV
jgi:hypothetical protein